MRKEHTTILSIVAFMCLALTATEAVTQTKTSTASPPAKKSSPVAARTIPPIKCTDPDGMVACKSFKQLVAARDQRLMDVLVGTLSKSKHVNLAQYYRHIAYVCLEKSDDNFKTVDFNLPKANSYKPYSSYLNFIVDNENVMKKDFESIAFSGPPLTLPVVQSVQDQWFNEYSNFEIYDVGFVDVHFYQDGLHVGWEKDYGKWSRPSETQNDPTYDDKAMFEGAYEWLARHTGDDKASPDIGDDPEHAHISIVDGMIRVHLHFKSQSGGNTDYRLYIQESTGRFTETFTPFDKDATEHSGTCMIFKQ